MKLLATILSALLFGIHLGAPISSAATTGCPDTWNLVVSQKSGITAPTPRFSYSDDPFISTFEESTGQLASALKTYGPNIASSITEEFSQDGKTWIDINNYPTINGGYFSNSFRASKNLFVNFSSMFKYFSGGKVRIVLKVETKDCPSNPGLYYSKTFDLPTSKINMDKKYDLASLLPATVNFKDSAAAVQSLKDWVAKMSNSLSTRGVSDGWDDTPPLDSTVVISDGNPPCVNYANRGWAATESDCSLLVFYIVIENKLPVYYLIDTVKVSSPVKAANEKALADKAAAESKAKEESDAKSLAEKIIADAKAEAAKILAEAKAQAAALTKKSTITCVKGKTIKKVTSFNPVCPAGYIKK